MVPDQAFIGVNPSMYPGVSRGTYHGPVFVIQSAGKHIGDGWAFVVAFKNMHDANAELKRLDNVEANHRRNEDPDWMV